MRTERQNQLTLDEILETSLLIVYKPLKNLAGRTVTWLKESTYNRVIAMNVFILSLDIAGMIAQTLTFKSEPYYFSATQCAKLFIPWCFIEFGFDGFTHLLTAFVRPFKDAIKTTQDKIAAFAAAVFTAFMVIVNVTRAIEIIGCQWANVSKFTLIGNISDFMAHMINLIFTLHVFGSIFSKLYPTGVRSTN